MPILELKRLCLLNIIYMITIFGMGVIVFLGIRIVAYYIIGGSFLFSFEDIKKAFFIGISVGALCGSATWLMALFASKSRMR